jgi:hypothetical protein
MRELSLEAVRNSLQTASVPGARLSDGSSWQSTFDVAGGMASSATTARDVVTAARHGVTRPILPARYDDYAVALGDGQFGGLLQRWTAALAAAVRRVIARALDLLLARDSRAGLAVHGRAAAGYPRRRTPQTPLVPRGPNVGRRLLVVAGLRDLDCARGFPPFRGDHHAHFDRTALN